MKPTVFIAFILLVIYLIVSAPFLFLIWFLGGNKPFKNITDAFNKIVFEQ